MKEISVSTAEHVSIYSAADGTLMVCCTKCGADCAAAPNTEGYTNARMLRHMRGARRVIEWFDREHEHAPVAKR